MVVSCGQSMLVSGQSMVVSGQSMVVSSQSMVVSRWWSVVVSLHGSIVVYREWVVHYWTMDSL